MTPGAESAKDSSVVAHATSYCLEQLEGAIRSLGGACGAVYGIDASAGVSLVASAGDDVLRGFGTMERAALRALAMRRPLFEVADGQTTTRFRRSRVRGGPDGEVSSGDGLTVAVSSRNCVALPVFLDRNVVAVVTVLGVDGRDFSLEACEERLRAVLFPMAVMVDRLRIQASLESRGAQIESLRQQLDSYAVDFRSTYLSERSRSDELALALAELETTYRATVQGLAIAVESKDECTGGHLHRVSRYGMMLTNLLAPDHAEDAQFQYGFLLHDIGKLTVPDAVLTKPGSLTAEEWELMRQHPDSGRSILDGIPFLDGAREIVYAHHERWDGTGYPRGLAGYDIPLGALIFPLCDAFDAMTSDRPYRMALSVTEALSQLRQGGGTQFWPDAVEAFLTLPTDELSSLLGASRTR